eukprot:3710331-Rhodomonas_salina.1
MRFLVLDFGECRCEACEKSRAWPSSRCPFPEIDPAFHELQPPHSMKRRRAHSMNWRRAHSMYCSLPHSMNCSLPHSMN